MARMNGEDDDRLLMERYLAYKLGKPLRQAKHGELMDVYRTIGLQFGVRESSPRMWRMRGKITSHVRRQIIAEMANAANPALTIEDLSFDPAVMDVAREIQNLYVLTRGRGEVWRSLLHTIELAKTWAKKGRPQGAQHMRPLPRG